MPMTTRRKGRKTPHKGPHGFSYEHRNDASITSSRAVSRSLPVWEGLSGSIVADSDPSWDARHGSHEALPSNKDAEIINHNSLTEKYLSLDLGTTNSSHTFRVVSRGLNNAHSLLMPAQKKSSDVMHVHPSLRMTAQEFSEAKLIILDLLGWGVPSEYLLRCGLGREFIYYAFTELNLRLPKGFDIDGIEPFESPPHHLTSR